MIKVIVNPDPAYGKIKMSPETHRKLGAPDNIELCFGQIRKRLPIKTDSVEAGTVIVPSRLTPRVSIPALPYEVKWEEGRLHLGPVIGFMNNPMFFQNPEWIATRFERYSDYKGVIFIFARKHVDTKNKLIRGKYYNPATNSFVEAVLPYPSVVYFRTNPKPKLYRHFKQHIGEGKLYNYPYRSNKWVFWRLAKDVPRLNRHLSETREFNTMEDLLEMLCKHKTVYLKPYNWSRGTACPGMASAMSLKIPKATLGQPQIPTYSKTCSRSDRGGTILSSKRFSFIARGIKWISAFTCKRMPPRNGSTSGLK